MERGSLSKEHRRRPVSVGMGCSSSRCAATARHFDDGIAERDLRDRAKALQAVGAALLFLPPNMALQRTGRPRIRSGRSLRSLGFAAQRPTVRHHCNAVWLKGGF